MRRVFLSLTLILSLGAAAPVVRAQPTPPAPGVDMPPSVREAFSDKSKFQLEHGWIEKTRRAREARERYVAERGFYKRDMLQAVEQPRYSVTGNFFIPVFCVKYTNTGADPFPISQLQAKLFDGPNAPQTMTEFYSEISYGDLNVTGTVYGWTPLPNTDAYYAGAGTCNGLGVCGHVKQLIASALTANDPAVNFGQYDNDGPDGLPNSGDDDGYVDFAAFVHPEAGAECGINGNIWSHRSSLGSSVFTTNDARTGGGFIRVDDYVIQPIYNCDATTMIDIGVFCHEFGHAFGLPDLYDTDGGSQGVGYWCLMGSGSWNTPDEPAHMSAWSKNQLGWSNVVVAPAVPAAFNIRNVEDNRDIYRLDVMHERWRRMTDCKITGNYSMRCGLLASEAALRNWVSGSGYGNRWETAVSRDYNYTAGTITLSYQYSYDLEPSYDFAYGEVTSGGVTNTFAAYDGTGSGTASINITPYLAPGPYTIRFRVSSDAFYSDQDGNYPTACGAMVLDNINVSGNGAANLSDFETNENGWAEEMSPPAEYFLVENRQPLGSDVNIKGGGGLAIWHVDTGDQTGGPSNNQPRRVAVEQADGLFNLEGNVNRGDAGDPYPGSTGNFAFNGGTTPNSDGHDGPSTVAVTLNTGNGDPINATLVGGWPAPAPASVTPVNGLSGTTAKILTINGSLFAKTGTVVLAGVGPSIPATTVTWVGKSRITATFNLTGAPNGLYDVVVYNPGGASAVLVDAFEITGATPTAAGDLPLKFALSPNYPNPFNPSTTIRYEIASRTHVELRVFDVSGALVRTLVNESKAPGAYSLEWNGRDDKGTAVSSGVYFYRITAGDFSDVRKMTLLK